jgi:hypothetical protein
MYELTSDYVIRRTSDSCGPTYRHQQGAETCEWFVHGLPEGLAPGRYEIFAVWEASCWAAMGAADSCIDPSEVLGLFWAPVNSPFYERTWEGFDDQTGPSPWDHFRPQ